MTTSEQRCKQILEVIVREIERCGVPPSMREVSSEIGLAHSSVHKYVVQMISDDVLEHRTNSFGKAFYFPRQED